MASSIPTRCSPRSFERLCNGLVIQGLTTEQTATLLTLAHCTGWSADSISNKIQDTTGVKLTAESVWDTHRDWVWGRGGEQLSTGTTMIMKILLTRAGVNTFTMGAPLSRTFRPQTVKYVEFWSQTNPSPPPLFPGFTEQARELSKQYLFLAVTKSAYGKMTPIEEDISGQFGPTMVMILKEALKRWAPAMLSKLRNQPDLRPVPLMDDIYLIMNYLGVFEHFYASMFGKMEDGSSRQVEAGEDMSLHIRSTAFCAKLFLGFIMADRLHVVNIRRQQERQDIGFVGLDVSMLADDSKNCPICLDLMGVEIRDGIKEFPIKLVACCSQVIGHLCLKTWLCEFIIGDEYRNTCPMCRFNFPETFLDKLFSTEELIARLILQADQRSNWMSPSPAPLA